METKKIALFKFVGLFGLGLTVAGTVQAQTTGTSLVGAGWSMNSFTTNKDAGTLSGKQAHTGSVSFGYFVSDNLSVDLGVNIPVNLKLESKAAAADSKEVVKPIDATDFGKIKLTLPTAVIRYHFAAPDSKFHPFLGAGVGYAVFNKGELTADTNVTNAANKEFKFKNKLAPMGVAGVRLALDKGWEGYASVSYMPLKVDGTFNLKDANNQPKEESLKGIKLNPLTISAGLGFAF